MTNHTIDNSADGEFGKVILWQYDKAENIVAFVKSFLGVHDTLTKDLWDKLQKELNVDTASEFGLGIIGALLGVPWTTYFNSDTRVSADHYRQWIKAWAVLMRTDFTVPDIYQFFKSATITRNGYYFAPVDASIISRNVMALDWNMVRQTKNEITGEVTESVVDDWSSVEVELGDGVKAIAEYWLYTIRDAVNATGFPAAVRTNAKDDGVIFGFDGQQYAKPGDRQVGGFDDSNFIPEEYFYA